MSDLRSGVFFANSRSSAFNRGFSEVVFLKRPHKMTEENELAGSHLFLADDVKLIAPRSQQHELRSSIKQALNWFRRWDLPINASKSHYLSIGGHPNDRLVLSEEANG